MKKISIPFIKLFLFLIFIFLISSVAKANICEGKLVLEKEIIHEGEKAVFYYENTKKELINITSWVEDLDKNIVQNKKTVKKKVKMHIIPKQGNTELAVFKILMEVNYKDCDELLSSFLIVKSNQTNTKETSLVSNDTYPQKQVYETSLHVVNKLVPWLLICLAVVLSITLIIFREGV